MFIKVKDLEAVLAAVAVDPDSGEVDMGALLKSLHTLKQYSWEDVYNEQWIDAEKNPPERSDTYLVIYESNGYMYDNTLHYSVRHKQWNNYDDLDRVPDEEYDWHVVRYMPYPTSMSRRLQREYDKEVEDDACNQ